MPGGGSSLTPLNASDYDLKNMTQAMDFLSQMLDDSILQNNGKQYGLNFWYGAATVIGLAALDNLFSLISSQLRYACQDRHILGNPH
jgi:ferric-chelate reductase